MKKIVVILCVILLSTSLVNASLQFVNTSVKDMFWGLQVLLVISKIDQAIDSHGGLRQDCDLTVQRSQRDHQFQFSFQNQRLTLVDEVNPLVAHEYLLAHEYGHYLIDCLLRKKSEGWNYFLSKGLIGKKKLSEGIIDLENQINRLQEAKEEFAQSEESKKYVPSIEKSINQAKQDLDFIRLNARNDSTYGARLDLLPPNVAYRVIFAPYLELFADFLVAIIYDDWEVMESTVYSYAKSHKIDLYTGEMSLEKYSSYRGFKKSDNILSYNYQPQESESSYTQFYPMRSYLRCVVDSGLMVKTEAIGYLMWAILVEFEREMRMGNSIEDNLKEKNENLILFFEAYIEKQERQEKKGSCLFR